MAAARFVVVSDDDVNAFSEQQQKENTKKMPYDQKIFREFLETCDEKREIENITLVELQVRNHQKGLLAVQKKKKKERPRVWAIVYQSFSPKYRPLSSKK